MDRRPSTTVHRLGPTLLFHVWLRDTGKLSAMTAGELAIANALALRWGDPSALSHARELDLGCHVCWPSHGRLALDTGLSQRGVERAMPRLLAKLDPIVTRRQRPRTRRDRHGGYVYGFSRPLAVAAIVQAQAGDAPPLDHLATERSPYLRSQAHPVAGVLGPGGAPTGESVRVSESQLLRDAPTEPGGAPTESHPAPTGGSGGAPTGGSVHAPTGGSEEPSTEPSTEPSSRTGPPRARGSSPEEDACIDLGAAIAELRERRAIR